MFRWPKFSPIVACLVVVTAASCILYAPVFKGDVPLPTHSVTGLTWGNPDADPQQSIFRDRIVQAYPYHLFAAKTIQSGHVPLWNNLIFAGTTFFANGQAGILSLFKVPFWWLPPVDSFVIVTLLQSIVAAVGFAVLGRKMKWNVAASVVAGLTLTLSAPFVMRMTVTTMSAVFACLPFVLWGVLHLHEKLTWRWTAIVAGMIAVMIFAGHVQLAAFALGISTLWVLIWWRREFMWRRVFCFGMALALGLGLTAVQMLPVKEALGQAYRQPKENSWSRVLTPLRLFRVSIKDGAGLLTLVDQNIWGKEAKYHGPANYLEGNLYVGPLALLAIIISFGAWRKREWRLFAVLVVLNAGLFIFPGWWDLVGKIAPWLTVTPVWRTSFILAFSLAMLAGFGTNTFAKSYSHKYSWIFIGAMLVVSLWQWQGILPFAPRSTLFPQSALLSKAQELTKDGSRVWFPNGALDQFMPYNLPVSVGYDSVYPSSYLELWTANSERIEKRNQLVPIHPNDEVLAVTGSNVMITSDSVSTGWKEIMSEGKWHLAQRENSISPVHTVQKVIQTEDPAEVGKIDVLHEATVEVTAALPASYFNVDPTTTSVVTVLRQTSTNLRVKVTSSANTILVTNLQHYPGWHLKLDGFKSDSGLLKVNHAFQGAAVDTGEHTLEFYYAPRSYQIGLYVSVASLVVLVLGFWVMPKLRS